MKQGSATHPRHIQDITGCHRCIPYKRPYGRTIIANNRGCNSFSQSTTSWWMFETCSAVGQKRMRTTKQWDLKPTPLRWQMYNQLASLHFHKDVLYRKFDHRDSSEPYLQQIISPALVSKIITSLHNSAKAGHLSTHKTIEKIRQRYYWLGFKEDVQKHVRCRYRCQKRTGPPKTHRHSLIDWLVSYPIHHIGLTFLGPLPMSQSCQYILLNGDHFTKWYVAFPLPDQRTATTTNALLNHWICRFWCPRSIQNDHFRNLE